MASDDKALRVQRCTSEDRAAQAELFNRCFKKRVSADDLVWRYDANPHGTSESYLTREVAGGEPGRGVSGYACSPRRALVRGDEATLAAVGETGDVMTDPDFRKRGLFSALDRACMASTAARGWPHVFGLPNRRSAHIFLTLGWDRVGTLRPWTFLLRADAAARRLRLREGRLAALRVPLDRRKCAAARRTLAEVATGTTREALQRFPEEVEEISRAVEPHFAWMVRRDAAYLDWRFLQSPSGLHRAISVFDKGQLTGYAVVQLPRPGEALGFLVDVLGRDDVAVAGAVEAGLARLDEAGVSAVQATAVDGSWWNDVLVRSGFLAPKPDNHLIVIRYVHEAEHALSRAAGDASAWYFTDGDRDDETMG